MVCAMEAERNAERNEGTTVVVFFCPSMMTVDISDKKVYICRRKVVPDDDGGW